MPLWQENREKLTLEVIDSGFKAIVKIVESKYLDESFLGKVLDAQLVEKIKNTGADPCGENGEYHTFVIDGPIFNSALDVSLGEIIDFGNYKAIDIY